MSRVCPIISATDTHDVLELFRCQTASCTQNSLPNVVVSGSTRPCTTEWKSKFKVNNFLLYTLSFLAFRARKEAILRTSKRTDRLKMFSISIFCATTPDPRILWRVHFSTAKIIFCNSSTPQIPIYSSAYFSPLSSFTIAQKQYFALHFSWQASSYKILPDLSAQWCRNKKKTFVKWISFYFEKRCTLMWGSWVSIHQGTFVFHIVNLLAVTSVCAAVVSPGNTRFLFE